VRNGAVPARPLTAARSATVKIGKPTSRCASGWQQPLLLVLRLPRLPQALAQVAAEAAK
jgi:hypothetical protein